MNDVFEFELLHRLSVMIVLTLLLLVSSVPGVPGLSIDRLRWVVREQYVVTSNPNPHTITFFSTIWTELNETPIRFALSQELPLSQEDH